MPTVVGIRGPDPVRHCAICQEYTLQLIGTYRTDEWQVEPDGDGTVISEHPTYEYSHLPDCAVCSDKLKNGEITADGAVSGSVGGIRG